MHKHICIISHQHLCRNPRVLKEAKAIVAMGNTVTVLTSIYSSALLNEDQQLIENFSYQFYNNLTKKNLVSYFNRLCTKVGRWLTKIGLDNKWALGYAPNNCLRKSLNLNADLYILHQELPTYIGYQLIKRNKKVAFDFEDWYTEDLLSNAKKYRPDRLLRKAEQIGLSNAVFSYTTSVPMANALQARYSLAYQPLVIYNSFPIYNEQIKLTDHNDIRLIWLSQTIGPGRGLEEFIKGLNLVEKKAYTLHLRGIVNPAYQQILEKLLLNSLHKLCFLGLITNEAIGEDLTNYHMGLALESNTPLSRDLTLTNKVFHYLSVGLPVIASKTQGQLSLKKDFEKSIFYYQNREELVTILNDFEPLNQMSNQKILETYRSKYDWSIQAHTIQKLVREI